MKRKGFTLVELVITIAIIIILSSISVPIYKSYVYEAKMAEAYTLIASIRDAQFTYYNEYGNFLRDVQASGSTAGTSNEEVLGIDARGNRYFTWFNVGTWYSDPRVNNINGFCAVLLIHPSLVINAGKNQFLYLYNKTIGQKYVIGNHINQI